MNDLISRQVAIRKIKKTMDKSAKGDVGNFFNTIKQQDINILKSLPTVQSTPQWIPCSERLPENCSLVLVTDTWQGTRVDLAYCVDKRFYEDSYDTDATATITAWMPLPEPYKEDDNGKMD